MSTGPLSSDTIQVWRAELTAFMPQLDQYAALLSVDEQQRAARFLGDDVRWRFILSRGILRTILGSLLELSPQEVAFTYDEKGKPGLAPLLRTGGGWYDLQFNLAHSHDMLLVGITRKRPIGIDVERVRPIQEMTIMVENYFSIRERETWYRLPDAVRINAFFAAWTRKEAFIKAIGEGFSFPLADFDVTLNPYDPPAMLRLKGGDPSRWALVHLRPAPGYVGAVCVRGRDLRVIELDYLPPATD